MQLDKSGEVAKPQELKEDDIHTSENETAANILAVERILGEYGQVNIFRFVVNPHDFAESVENIFYLSFLIRDGKCSFNWSEGENPEPIICESIMKQLLSSILILDSFKGAQVHQMKTTLMKVSRNVSWFSNLIRRPGG